MSSVEQLMGVGETAEIAKRSGFFVSTISGSGTLKGPGNQIVKVSGTGLALDQSFAIGDIVIAMFVTNGTISAASCGFNISAVSVLDATAGFPKMLVKNAQDNWMHIKSATA